jgi:hypothetical protein
MPPISTRSLRAEVESLASEVVVAIGEALLGVFESRDYVFLPSSSLEEEEGSSHTRQCHGAYCYRESIVLDGWAIIIDVDSRDHPRLEAGYRALVEGSKRRLEQIIAYFKRR